MNEKILIVTWVCITKHANDRADILQGAHKEKES